jgi:glycosyltransferase involved in cell wall biosynthesis
MQKVEQSILAPGLAGARVIHNGVDLSIYRPDDKRAVKAALGLPLDSKVLLFAANGIRQNIWKDYQTLRTAVGLISEELRQQRIVFIALGEHGRAERIGRAEVRYIPYLQDRSAVARYYQAADLYLHAARADTFPNTVLEALACGTPVVATAVGGIPEQVKSLENEAAIATPGLNEATGILAQPMDAEGMADGVCRLLMNDTLRERVGENAARAARSRFDLQRQVDDYLNWYEEILKAGAS